MHNKKKSKSTFKKAGIVSGTTVAVFIVAFFIVFSVPKPMIQQTDEGEWYVVWEGTLVEAAENNPGAGATGWLEIFFINHTASPATAYDENTSATLESWCVANMAGKTPYASADEFNVELDSQVSFDLLVRARWYATHAKNATIFKDTRCRIKMNFTCTNWADGEDKAALTEGTLVVSGNNSAWDYIYCNVYWNADDNNGFQIDDDATLTIHKISIEAKY